MAEETESGANLLARKEYARAVPLLKDDVEKYPSNPRTRLQYAGSSRHVLNQLGKLGARKLGLSRQYRCDAPIQPVSLLFAHLLLQGIVWHSFCSCAFCPVEARARHRQD